MMMLLGSLLLLSACGGPQNEPLTIAADATPTQAETDLSLTEEQEQPQETTPGEGEAEPEDNGIHPDVPIMEGADKLVVASQGAYITYEVLYTVEEVKTFYQEQLLANGWEQKNKVDSGFGESVTIIRSKPEYNISVTAQNLAGREGTRILITLIKR